MRSKVQCGSISRAASIALALVVLLFAVIATPWAQAQTLKVLYSFKGGADGAYPVGSLVRDEAGNFYGTTSTYGGNGCYYCGTVFRLSKTGKLTVLYSFTGGTDGGEPWATLVRDSSGNLYGTTYGGGDLTCNSPYGCGTVFRLDETGKEKALISFSGYYGEHPIARLIRDSVGNFYGTAFGGGGASCQKFDGCGTVFKLNKNGQESLFYFFKGPVGDGSDPVAGLIRDSAGNLYGTTLGGGAYYYGTIFKLDNTGEENVLYAFTGGTDGGSPYDALIRDAAGNLYGTTTQGGDLNCNAPLGCGTLFKLDRNGRETVLYSFTAEPDGEYPSGSLLRDTAGNLYGTTIYGGGKACHGDFLPGCGTVFKLDEGGHETVLYKFTGGKQGAHPTGNLIRDETGNLYGVTESGGIYGFGVVFKLTP